MEGDDPVGKEQCLVHVVGNEHDGGTVAAMELAQQLVHLHPGKCVQGTKRLVEQQKLRLAHEGTGEGDTLSFASRQRQRPGIGVRFQPDLAQYLERSRASFALAIPIPTLRQTLSHGSNRGSWKATERAVVTSTTPR